MAHINYVIPGISNKLWWYACQYLNIWIKQALESDDDIERIRRAHMNDMENIYPFLVIGLLFAALSTDGDKNATLHFYIFTFFRFAHSIVYVNAVKQPARAICFLVNWLCNVSMVVQVIMKTF